MGEIGKVFSRGADIGKIREEGRKAGVNNSVSFMFGLPGGTEEDFEEVLKFLKKNKDYIGTVNPSPSFCGFAPGTKGYEEPEKHDIIADTGSVSIDQCIDPVMSSLQDHGIINEYDDL